MADVNSQVALGINAPDPNQGLNTLSKVLGLGQQGLAIRGQQSQNQSLQAEAQGAQQKMQERQLLQQTMKSGVRPDTGKSLYDANNQLDPDQLTDFATKNLPMIGQDVVQNILKTKSDKVALSSATADLTDKYKNDLSGITRSFVNKPDAKSDDVNGALKQYAQTNPDAAPAVLAATGLTSHLDNAPDQKSKNDVLIHVAQLLQPAATTAAQQTPSISTYQGKEGLQPLQTNPLAAGGVSNVGSPLTQGLAPTEKIPYRADVAAQTARQTGIAGGDVDRMNQVSTAVKGASAALPLTTQVDDLAEQIHSGKFAAAISNAAAAVGMSADTYARQELRKNLGQIKTAALAGPAGGSDSRAGVIESGFPDETSDPQTIHKAMDYARGSLREDLARGNNLNQYKQKHPDLSGFQTADDILTSHTDPLMHEFKALPPSQQGGFYRRNFASPQAAQAFKNKVKAADHTGLLGQ